MQRVSCRRWNPTSLKWQLTFAVGVLIVGVASRAEDWPFYRGPSGNGVATERISLDWPAGGPKRLWRVPLTNGLSSVTVSEGRVFTQVSRTVGDQALEFCVAYSAETGAMLWNRAFGTASYPNGGVGADDGPRSTPVVKAGRVYVLGSYLDLLCLDAASGAVVWSKDLRTEFGGSVIAWQNAASPVLAGDLVLLNVNAGPRRLAAFRADTGALAWRTSDERMTHATPVPVTLHGVSQVIFLTQNGLVSLAPDDGRELWRYAFSYSTSTGASPVVDGDTVYCSAAYGVGAAAVRIARSGDHFAATQLWRRRGALMNHWSTAVAKDGHVYGLYGQALHYSAPLKCVDLATGAEKWSQDGFGLGATLLVNDRILALTESGEIVVVEPDPTGYRERARFQAVNGRAWNSPAIANGRLFVRGTTEMAAYDVSLPAPKPLRLGAVERLADSALRFRVTSADGQPITPDRLGQIRVLRAGALAASGSDWQAQPAKLTGRDGAVVVEVAIQSVAAEAYFRVVEGP
ncbi:MAG: PQQ-binding-like beta-propeller repeat protein [Verrucomicrobia bacterium]|nr:PQQ-binding-like beta-propeller repeat protein [Verrucomicrobiota bacterium]